MLAHAHQQAMRVSVSEAAGTAHELLSRRLIAHMVGARDVKTINRWISGATITLRHDHEQRLRLIYEIIQLLRVTEGPQTIRAWFVGMNPTLDDASPAEAIHAGRLEEALGAARTFLALG
jgi:hypothetical protein